MSSAETLQMSFFIDLDDPQDLAIIKEAFCVLVETHLNYEKQAIIAVYRCWRNQKAYENRKEAFTSIQVSYTPEDGSLDFFKSQGLDGAKGFLGSRLTEFALKTKLPNARMAYAKKEEQ